MDCLRRRVVAGRRIGWNATTSAGKPFTLLTNSRMKSQNAGKILVELEASAVEVFLGERAARIEPFAPDVARETDAPADESIVWV